jgi:hypothetical protein
MPGWANKIPSGNNPSRTLVTVLSSPGFPLIEGSPNSKISQGEIMAHLYSTKQKIALANNIIQNSCGNKDYSGYNDQLFKILRKIEKKYLKNKSYDLSDFAICLSELPHKHLKLMLTIGWLHPETEAPHKYFDGFYKEAYSNTPGCTQIKHYITVDTYIHLLFIELQIIEMYSDVGTASKTPIK